jgi:hypothetical protein
MLPLKPGLGGFAVLVLGSALACGTAVTEGGQPAAADSAKQKKQEQTLEQALYRRLREDGFIKGAECRYELYVRRVEGRKLIDLEFKRRDESGTSYDVVARAHESELRVHLPTRQVQVHMRRCYITSTDPNVATGLVEDKVWPVDLRDLCPDFGK